MRLLALALTTALVAANEAVFTPYRISYNDMIKDSSFEAAQTAFIDALETHGIISVAGIPSLHKKDTLATLFLTLHACSLQSKTTQEHTYDDGTLRRTMATHTVPGAGGVQRMMHQHYSSACRAFEEASTPFRMAVADVTQLFSQRLASVLNHSGPLLSTEHGYNFDTIQDVVEAGEHLEHFHSYQKDTPKFNKEEETIHMHVDKGLFIAFTPGRLIDPQDPSKAALTSGFFIEEQDGTVAEVAFGEEDDLIFMLGDGVNQYINNRLSKNKLRAVPHMLLMAPTHSKTESRVWYGRMVLPPTDALHPAHGITFEDLHKDMIESSLHGEENPGLGCSGGMVARQLETTSCEADTLFCWEKCMTPSEYNVSESICQEQGLNLTCTNEERQLYVSGHGPFFPGCIDIANAEEVYGNPIHPSEQNNTNTTDQVDHSDHSDHDHTGDGSHSQDDMTSGTALFGSLAALAMTVISVFGFFV